MRRKEIPKRSGGVRVVFCPSGRERKLLRKELKRLSSHTTVTLPYAHGFMPERSPLTAAKVHIGYAVTIGLDLKDFFPSVKPAMVKGLVPKDLNPLCWGGDGCGQGLPTAPAIANLAAKSMDDAVVKLAKKLEKEQGLHYAYSRYADDLSLSLTPDPGQSKIVEIKSKLTEVVRRCGFVPNPRKWRVQRACGGRREVVGLLVGDTDDPIRPLRAWRRKYRALVHKIELARADGARASDLIMLTQKKQGWDQWMVPKTPLCAEEKKKRIDGLSNGRALEEANRICTKAKVKTMTPMRKEITPIQAALPDGKIVRITNDPAYFIGISDFVTRGQRSASCLRVGLAHDSGLGQYGGTGAWWWQMRGCSIAHVIDPKNIIDCAGVKRPAQIARVLVFKLSTGQTVYQRRIYGESHIEKLTDFLHDNGIRRARDGAYHQRTTAVLGEVKREGQRPRPYLDAGGFKVIMKGGVPHDSVEI